MDIVTFLSSQGITVNHKEANNAYIECPRCGKENLSINVFNGVWHCYSAECVVAGAKGSFADLMKTLSLNSVELPSFSAPPVQDKTLSEEDISAIKHANTNVAEILEWATTRKLDGKFVLSQGVGYDSSQRAMVFPYHDDQGKLVGAKYKSERGQWIKGKEPKLYLLDHADLMKEKIVLVEGEADALTLKQLGIAVAATLGATKNKGFDLLRGIRQIYLGFDMDPAGDTGTEKAAHELGRYRCKRVTWKEKDVNDWLQAGGTRDEIINAVRDAKPMVTDSNSLNGLSALNAYFDSHKRGLKPRRSWGWPRLDGFTKGLSGGQLIGVLAESGTGKTTFILNAIRNHVAQGYNCGLASLEEHPLYEITPKLYSCFMGRNINKLKLAREDAKEVEADMGKVHLFTKQVDRTEVIEWIKECYYLHDCKMVAVDYFQLLVRDEESTQDIKETIFALKNLVVECPELCILLVIQPKQSQQWRRSDGSEAKPLKLDGKSARGGSAINQTVDAMLTIKGVDGQPNITQYEYTKVRGHLNVDKRDWLNKFTQLEYSHDTLRMTEKVSMVY